MEPFNNYISMFHLHFSFYIIHFNILETIHVYGDTNLLSQPLLDQYHRPKKA